MRSKVSVPPCRFCGKVFQRTEHHKRHERTHTKERPFRCVCNKSFSRQDLLTRHVRLAGLDHAARAQDSDSPEQISVRASDESQAHLNRQIQHEETPTISGDSAFPTTNQDQNLGPEMTGTANFETPLTQSVFPLTGTNIAQDVTTAGYGSSLFASNEGYTTEQTTCGPGSTYEAYNVGIDKALHDASGQLSGIVGSQDNFRDDLDVLWGGRDPESALLPSFLMDTNFLVDPFPDISLADAGGMVLGPGPSTDVSGDSCMPMEPGALSRYGSRLPSPDAEQRPLQSSALPETPTTRKLGPIYEQIPWQISRTQYTSICAAIDQEQYTSLGDYVHPSRHAFRRYFEGYFSGFHSHLPFIHQATLDISKSSPELILALAAVGAQYRFQYAHAYGLYVASRALVEKKLRDQDTNQSRTSTAADSTDSGFAAQLYGREDSHEQSPQYRSLDTTMQTMQAMILLIALGTWNDRALLKDARSMGSQLAQLVRDTGLTEDNMSHDQDWITWVKSEGTRRTKIVAYCFLNLHSITYNYSPELLNREVHLDLPHSENQWKASSVSEWQEERMKESGSVGSFQNECSRLFEEHPQSRHSRVLFSSFGNYVMMHAVLQQIFFARQLSLCTDQKSHKSLDSATVKRFEIALRRWQRNWESTKDSSIDPCSPTGPLSFNAVALLRIAYIRLHVDIGPSRELSSRDPMQIALALTQISPLASSASVGRAVLQSIHSLSIPVKIGIEYVARTQTLTWSVIHSLCNLECAVCLSHWLRCTSRKCAKGEGMDPTQLRLLGLVHSLLQETNYGPLIEEETDLPQRYLKMAVAVVRLWAQTFDGSHVFPLMSKIGAGLGLFAEILNGELTERTE